MYIFFTFLGLRLQSIQSNRYESLNEMTQSVGGTVEIYGRKSTFHIKSLNKVFSKFLDFFVFSLRIKIKIPRYRQLNEL